MHVLAICRECEEPFMYWAIERPPPQTTACEICGGQAVIARGNEAGDIAALFDDVFRGFPPRKRKLAALKIASRIASGKMPFRPFVESGGKPTKASKRDASAGHILGAGFVAGAALLYVITRPASPGASLDDQVRDIALNVLRKRDAEMAWIPGPSEPRQVLGKPAKPKRKKGSQEQSQKPRQIETSGGPKQSPRGSAKAKKKR